jgi:hypothetical protein
MRDNGKLKRAFSKSSDVLLFTLRFYQALRLEDGTSIRPLTVLALSRVRRENQLSVNHKRGGPLVDLQRLIRLATSPGCCSRISITRNPFVAAEIVIHPHEENS